MSLSPGLSCVLESTLNSSQPGPLSIDRYQSCAGGCINNSGIIECGDLQFFVKFNHNALPGFFEAEAHGLQVLADTLSIRVPEVLGCSTGNEKHPAFLLLEALQGGPETKESAELYGQDLAKLHRNSQSEFGFDQDNFIGSTPQLNSLTKSWTEFFIEQRLRPQLKWIRDKGQVSKAFQQSFDKLLHRLDKLFQPAREAPSLIHGDLWSGNSMTVGNGRTAIYDPAVYYGHREADIAMTELFGRLPQRFYEAYNESFPLSDGYEDRRDLYNLYHMLNHWNLFGSSYHHSCSQILTRYAG
jgi:protein-ribulosamine 3-kinase